MKNLWVFTVGIGLALRSSLFGVFGLTTNVDPDKYKYSGNDTGFDARWHFSSSDVIDLAKM